MKNLHFKLTIWENTLALYKQNPNTPKILINSTIDIINKIKSEINNEK